MKVKKLLAVGLAATFTLLAGCSSSSTSDENAGGSVSSTAPAVATTASDSQSSSPVSGSLTDYQIQINGELYAFPMTVAEFEQLGWSFAPNQDDGRTVPAGKFVEKKFTASDGSCIDAFLINHSAEEQPYADCYVAGIEVFADDVKFDINTIVMAKGITFGVSTEDDITEAFGNNADIFDKENYKYICYEEDSYNYVYFYVYKDTNTLKRVCLFTDKAPENLPAEDA